MMTKAEIDRLERVEDRLEALKDQVSNLRVRMAYYNGGIAVLVLALNFGVTKGWF